MRNFIRRLGLGRDRTSRLHAPPGQGHDMSPQDAEPRRVMELRFLHDEAERQAAYGLLRQRINDVTLFRYLPERGATVLGHQIELTGETLIGLYDSAQHLVGTAYCGPEWDSLIDNGSRGANHHMIRTIEQSVMFLHGIAIDSDAEGIGLGRMLVNAVEDHARARGMHCVVGVTGAQESPFYARLGYTLLGPGTTLVLNATSLGSDQRCSIGMPITGDSQWFAKPLTGRPSAGIGQKAPDGAWKCQWLLPAPFTAAL